MASKKTVRIPVPGGLMVHGAVLTEVVLREPTYDEYLMNGEPTSLAKAPNGALFAVEDGETIRRYTEICLVEPKDPLLLGQGGVKLARAVKAAVLSFFHDDSSETEPSKTSQTTSSFDAASPPMPSAG